MGYFYKIFAGTSILIGHAFKKLYNICFVSLLTSEILILAFIMFFFCCCRFLKVHVKVNLLNIKLLHIAT